MAFAGYPLAVEGRVVGVLAVFSRHAFSESVLADLAPLADAIAQCIERKRGEEALRESEGRHRFLAELAAATQPLTDPAESWRRRPAARRAPGRGPVRVRRGRGRGRLRHHRRPLRGVPSIVGRWPVAAFGAEHHRLMRANEPYVVEDADADPRVAPEDLPAYRATTIRAVICVPLHKDGRFTAAMAVHQKAPRRWTPEEVALVRTVVGRCWEALERARVTRNLRESEERAADGSPTPAAGFMLPRSSTRGTDSPAFS